MLRNAALLAIADKSFIVFKFNVIAVDIDGRQTMEPSGATAGTTSVSAILTSPHIR